MATDIRWERICPSQDMIDPHACDETTPPKWQTSVAVFRYVPEDEYQVYVGRQIVYYKLACTITSYQPQSDEIQGAIEWGGVRAQEVADFERRLRSYHPCHGAMIQVTVAPSREGTDLQNYPYFLDFEPKQRMLYEQASDTSERASRSLESVNVRKGAGTTESTEILDVDQGFSIGIQGQYAGTGGGVTYGRQGQWGSKRLGQEEVENVRTSESARESRETLSHTTQISQMYTLLQSYHVGTNRALFYIAPRPHVLEEPSGLINGPRRIDGIQELFLVVSQPKDERDTCLSVRVDTSHLTSVKTFDYERPEGAILFPPDPMVIHALPPGRDTPDRTPAASPSPYYDCFETRVRRDETYTAPPGFVIEAIEYAVTDARSGSVRHTVASDGGSATLTVEAVGAACFLNSRGSRSNTGEIAGQVLGAVFTGGVSLIGGVGASLADVMGQQSGVARGQLRIRLRSRQRTRVSGTSDVLLVTSRGLCCCDRKALAPAKIIALEPLDELLNSIPWEEISSGATGKATTSAAITPARGLPTRLTARQANVVTEVVTDASQRISASVAKPHEQPGLDTAYMLGHLLNAAAATPARARVVSEPALSVGLLDTEVIEHFAQLVGRDAEEISRHDVASAPDDVLQETTGLEGGDLVRLRLHMLGFPTASPMTAT